MAKKLDYDAEVGEAVDMVRSGSKQERFGRAKATLQDRPTGYSEPSNAQGANRAGEGATASPSSAIMTPTAIALAVTKGSASSRLGTPSYIEVPLDLIDENPYNARHIYKPEKVADLARSMAADGQLIPGLAARRGDRYILIAGHYRKKAAKQGGLPTLKLMVYDNVSDQDLYLLSYKENAEHNEQTALDNAFAWRLVLDNKVYDSEVELAEAIGMSKSNVNKTLAIMKLESVVLEVISQNPEQYGLSVLYELHLLQQAGGSVLAADMAGRVVEQGIGRKEIAMARERVETAGSGGRRRRNETSRLYRLANGQVRDWDSGRVLIDVKIDSEEDKQAFLEEMRLRFKGGEEAQ